MLRLPMEKAAERQQQVCSAALLSIGMANQTERTGPPYHSSSARKAFGTKRVDVTFHTFAVVLLLLLLLSLSFLLL